MIARNQEPIENKESNSKIYSDFLPTDNFRTIIRSKKYLYTKKINSEAPHILIDSSLIIDVLLGRNSSFLEAAIKIIELVFSENINGYISEVGLRDIWDITRELKGEKDANYLLIKLLNSFNVCNLEKEIIKKLSDYYLNSVESGMQIECAKKNNLDAIITLREKDFLGCDWENIFTPFQFLDNYENKNFYRDKFKKEIIGSKNRENLKKLFHKSDKEENQTEIEDLYLFDGWKVKHFNLLASKNKMAEAAVALSCDIIPIIQNDNIHVFRAWDCGSITALFKALDKAIIAKINQDNFINYSLSKIEISQLESGVESSICASIILNIGNHKLRSFHIHKDIIKACFYAYVKAIRNIYSIEFLKGDSEKINLFSNNINEMLEFYQNGQRDFSEMLLNNIDLEGENLPHINLSHSDLSSSNLKYINLDHSNLRQVNFKDSNLFHACLKNSDLYQANLERTKLNKADLSQSNLINANLTEANLDNARLLESNLSSATLIKGILSEAILTRSNLSNANLQYANLSGADLNKANLSGANLTNANLSKADLNGANLTNANLSKTDLSGANLTNANLSKADLSGANLTNTNLSKADLSGVDLSTGIIDGTNLSEANLSKSNLQGLDLNKTIFCKPILTDTKMPEIKIEIYGIKRIEKMIQFLNSFDSDQYVIYAVHSSTFGYWWNSEIGQSFREVNKKLSYMGISIKRVFIVPNFDFNYEIMEIIEEQVNSGIKVRYISEKLAENFNGFDLRTTNLLVCKNVLVPENSFTTTMIFNKDKEEESGYMSFVKDDIETNEQRFTMLWENANPYTEEVNFQSYIFV
jgi:uncharacterized protein YjbI with pentapeptide repeats